MQYYQGQVDACRALGVPAPRAGLSMTGEKTAFVGPLLQAGARALPSLGRAMPYLGRAGAFARSAAGTVANSRAGQAVGGAIKKYWDNRGTINATGAGLLEVTGDSLAPAAVGKATTARNPAEGALSTTIAAGLTKKLPFLGPVLWNLAKPLVNSAFYGESDKPAPNQGAPAPGWKR